MNPAVRWWFHQTWHCILRDFGNIFMGPMYYKVILWYTQQYQMNPGFQHSWWPYVLLYYLYCSLLPWRVNCAFDGRLEDDFNSLPIPWDCSSQTFNWIKAWEKISPCMFSIQFFFFVREWNLYYSNHRCKILSFLLLFVSRWRKSCLRR